MYSIANLHTIAPSSIVKLKLPLNWNLAKRSVLSIQIMFIKREFTHTLMSWWTCPSMESGRWIMVLLMYPSKRCSTFFKIFSAYRQTYFSRFILHELIKRLSYSHNLMYFNILYFIIYNFSKSIFKK